MFPTSFLHCVAVGLSVLALLFVALPLVVALTQGDEDATTEGE